MPGVSVASELGGEVVFLAPSQSTQMISSDYRTIPVLSRPLLGGGIRRKLVFSLLLLPSLLQSLWVIARERPRVVLGTGGYPSVSPLLAAWLLGVGMAIQEQNVVPGLATRALAMIANKVFISYEETARWLPRKRLSVTGNPVRRAIGRPTREEGSRHLGLDPEIFTVLVLGGSRGSRSINRALAELLQTFPATEQIQFVGVVGESSRSELHVGFRSEPHRAVIVDFTSQIEYAYAACDLVVSRAGATTISELLACAKPSILVPYPYAGGHQEFNAMLLEKHGAAIVVADGDLNGQRLGEEIEYILHDQTRRHRMSERAESLAKKGAARKIAEELERCSDT